MDEAHENKNYGSFETMGQEIQSQFVGGIRDIMFEYAQGDCMCRANSDSSLMAELVARQKCETRCLVIGYLFFFILNPVMGSLILYSVVEHVSTETFWLIAVGLFFFSSPLINGLDKTSGDLFLHCQNKKCEDCGDIAVLSCTNCWKNRCLICAKVHLKHNKDQYRWLTCVNDPENTCVLQKCKIQPEEETGVGKWLSTSITEETGVCKWLLTPFIVWWLLLTFAYPFIVGGMIKKSV
jgi:hypothetical protein